MILNNNARGGSDVIFFKSGDVILDLGFGLQELSAKWLSVAGNNAKLVLKDFLILENRLRTVNS